jgi:DNA invertase Pin-like site-specific DNA recombinase
MTGEVLGYARSSTAHQKFGLEAQIEELRAAGCTRIFSETVSSIDSNRTQLQAALQFLRAGDRFVCTRPDRLARNTAELLRITEELSKRGVAVQILSMNIDTSTSTGKLLLTLMAGIATFERELMLERQLSGIAAAKAAGKYKGRIPTARAKTDDVVNLKHQGTSAAAIAKQIGISKASVYRILANHPVEHG